MQVKQEELSPCEIELEIEVDAEKVTDAVDKTFKELGKVAKVDGFRKGKVPRAILEKVLDRDKVKDYAADMLLPPAYLEAIEQAELDPWALPDFDIVRFEVGEPMVFKAKVPLEPKIEIGKYIGLDVQRNVPPVADEGIDAEIKRFLERQAEYTAVTDRPAQQGDSVVVETVNEEDPDQEPKSNVAVVGENLPDFDRGVVGMTVDQEKVINVTYPEDHPAEELKGKTLSLRTKLVELYDRKLPELTDDWVRKTFVGEPLDGEESKEPEPDAVDTVEKLRVRIRSGMEKSEQEVADMAVENNIVGQIVQGSNVNFPEVMVNHEINRRVESLLAELKKREVTVDDYLKRTDQTIEQLRADYEDDARKTVTTSLLLREIIDKEEIEVIDDDIDAELKAMAADRQVPLETIRAYIDSTDGLQGVRNRVLHKKLMDFLVHASNIKNVGQ